MIGKAVAARRAEFFPLHQNRPRLRPPHSRLGPANPHSIHRSKPQAPPHGPRRSSPTAQLPRRNAEGRGCNRSAPARPRRRQNQVYRLQRRQRRRPLRRRMRRLRYPPNLRQHRRPMVDRQHHPPGAGKRNGRNRQAPHRQRSVENRRQTRRPLSPHLLGPSPETRLRFFKIRSRRLPSPPPSASPSPSPASTPPSSERATQNAGARTPPCSPTARSPPRNSKPSASAGNPSPHRTGLAKSNGGRHRFPTARVNERSGPAFDPFRAQPSTATGCLLIQTKSVRAEK